MIRLSGLVEKDESIPKISNKVTGLQVKSFTRINCGNTINKAENSHILK